MSVAIRARSIALLVLGLGDGTVTQATAQVHDLRLGIILDKEIYFEGEPVYYAVELRNTGADTAWVTTPFEVTTGHITTELRHGEGTGLHRTGVHVLTVYSEQFRRWIPPGEAIFEVAYVQREWGDSPPRGLHLLKRRLPVGNYQFTARYRLWDGRTLADTTRFRVRPPTSVEVAVLQDLERISQQASEPSRRNDFLASLKGFLEARLRADAADPFLPLVLLEGVGLAEVLASGGAPRVDDALRTQFDSLRVRVIQFQPNSAAAAYAVNAVYAKGRHLPPTVVAELGNSLSAQHARAMNRQRRQ